MYQKYLAAEQLAADGGARRVLETAPAASAAEPAAVRGSTRAYGPEQGRLKGQEIMAERAARKAAQSS